MDTFTLIVWFYASGLTRDEVRTPGLTEIECKLQAAEVQKPKRARCEHDLKRFERQCVDCRALPSRGPA
jgi:hypothetical protein